MIYAKPAASFSADVESFPTGLAGSVAVQILDSDGNVVVARSTTGIVESPAGSGSYIATLTAPATVGDYVVFWDDGTVTPFTTASEDLVVTTAPVGNTSYIDETSVKESLTLQGTSYADDDVTRAVNAANASIDELFGRSFTQDSVVSDRFYSVRRRGQEVVYIHDLTRATVPAVAVDAARDGTFSTALVENTDFVFEPLNAVEDGKPYEKIVMIRGFLPKGPRIVKATGTFGWPGSVPPQILAFAEVLAVKLVTRFREAPFGIVTVGADMGVAMRMAKMDPDFPTLSAGLCRGALIS